MTCRVARWSQDHTHMELVYCGECGSANLEVCSTSHTLGPHLCPICTQSKVERGVATDSKTRSPNVTTDEGAERIHFSAPNVGASLIGSNVNDMAARIRQLPLPDWRCVLQTTIELLVIGFVTLLVLLWLMMFVLWSVPTRLSSKVWRGRNLFRYGLLLIGSGVHTSNEPRKSRLF
jgi:hypothetical protein